MNEKIRWYREVLELEPSSKVFFPLARLFLENEQLDDAVDTLRRGLERHPEHLEARMLLIECLDVLGQELEADDETEILSTRLRQYPQFWQAWGRTLAASPESKDASLALDFLAASFESASISWATVIEQGLRALSRKNVVSDADRVAYTPTLAMREVKVSAASVPPVPPMHEKKPIHADSDDSVEKVQESVQRPWPRYEDHAPRGNADEVVEERLSLRTRSMADVLAKQGDIKGATEILDELLAGTTDDEARREILARKETLSQAVTVSDPAGEEGGEQPLHSKHKLLHMLEALAERLESRVVE